MFKTKRKRAVVLALIAFFCTAAVTYVAVDWRRFGGGFLAFLRGNGEQHLASSGGPSAGAGSGHIDDGATNRSNAPSLPQMTAAVAHRKRLAGASGGAGHGKSDDDLFTYGNPAAGGIPPGSFIVAQNDTPSGGIAGGGTGPSPSPSGAGEDGSSSGGGGVSSPAPAPTTGNGGSGGIVLSGTGKTPTPPPPPASTPPAPTPPAPAPAPTQSGTTDSDPPPPPPSAPPTDTPPPPTSLPPVSAVPEASSLAMMSLGALFLAVAAQRKRKNG